MAPSKAYREKKLARTAMIAGAALACTDDAGDDLLPARGNYLRLTMDHFVPVVSAFMLIGAMAYALI